MLYGYNFDPRDPDYDPRREFLWRVLGGIGDVEDAIDNLKLLLQEVLDTDSFRDW